MWHKMYMAAPIFPLVRLEPTTNYIVSSFLRPPSFCFQLPRSGLPVLYFILLFSFSFSFSVWLGVLLAISRATALKTDCLLF